MMYTEFTAGNKTYKLRLTIRAIVELEKKLGCNPLSIFGEGDTIPTITTMVHILHSSLQEYEHGISLNDAYSIFDEYLANNSMTDFLPVIIELYKVSGLIKNEDLEKN